MLCEKKVGKMDEKGKMKDKKISEILNRKILLVGVLLLILLISITIYTQEGGESEEELQVELANLTAYLDEQSYDWLANYSLIKFIKSNCNTTYYN